MGGFEVLSGIEDLDTAEYSTGSDTLGGIGGHGLDEPQELDQGEMA